MIAEKLLAQEAVARRLDADSLYLRAVAEVTKLLTRDALYRLEVSDRVVITDAELREGFRRARNELLVRFMYLDDSVDAAFVRSQMQTSRDFDRLYLDSTIGGFRDTATVLWGEADTSIESAAYVLQPGSVSNPVAAGDGYYILSLAGTSPNRRFSALDAASQRVRVESTLRRRKESARTAEYLRAAIPEGAAYSPPLPFKELARHVADVFAERGADPGGIQLTPEMGADLRRRCASIGRDTVLVAGSAAWTVDESIQLLIQKGFVIAGDARRRSARRLYDVFWEWSTQELLAQEGFRRGLDATPEVQAGLAPWRDHYLAILMKGRVASGVQVQREDVYRYLSARDTAAPIPLVRVRELRTRSLEAMGDALSALEGGMPFEDVVEQWTEDPEVSATHGVTPWFPITDRPPVGVLAAGLEVGDRFGPVRDSTGYVYFELLERDNRAGDSSATADYEQARRELTSLLAKSRLTDFLAKIGQERGFEAYTDRLRDVDVSAVPMMTYRFLGFGGRMFAFPFVDPQVDWLQTEPPADLIVP
jgi:parvulin-like peptidyl-prolyl isomerase